MRILNMAFVVLLAAGAGCGKNGTDSGKSSTTVTPPEPLPPPTAAPTPSAVVKPVHHVELQIASVANTMTFDKATLTVPTGAEVHLTLKNNATMSTLPHNWVLVKPGTEASVAAAGLKRGEKAGYVEVFDHDMLTNTPQAKPGESADVTFTAPDPGTYPYICTTPGHYMMMKGVLTVTP
jgi:azurin